MSHPPALPHGAFAEVFPDVFSVLGTYRFGPGYTIPRRMTVVREGEALTVISPVRLNPAAEADLAALGRVEHVVKLGDFHSHDDGYYLERYKPRVWAAPGAKFASGLAVTDVLEPGGPTPFSRCQYFRFQVPKRPEGAFFLDRDGGILLTVDSLQYYLNFAGLGFTWLSALSFRAMGFRVGMNIGPGWRMQLEPKENGGFGPDFRRLLDLPFTHLLAAHGDPVWDTAHKLVQAEVDRCYGVRP